MGCIGDIIDEVAGASRKCTVDNTRGSSEGFSRNDVSRFTFNENQSAGQIHSPAAERCFVRWQDIDLSATFFRHAAVGDASFDRPQFGLRPMPWDVWPYEPAIHLMLFVHRVDGLTPGLYFLVRDPQKLLFGQHAKQNALSPAISCDKLTCIASFLAFAFKQPIEDRPSGKRCPESRSLLIPMALLDEQQFLRVTDQKIQPWREASTRWTKSIK